MQVVVDGLLTQYEQQGSKRPVILLVHGWGDRLQTYDALVGKLAKSHTIVRLDLPGFGATEPPKTTWGLEDYAEFVVHFLDKLSLKPSVMVGHSNGGAVLIKGIASQRLKTNHLVLLASAGVRNRQTFRKRVIKLVAKVGKVATCWLPRATRQRLQRKLYGTIGSDYLVVPHLQGTFKRTVAEDIVSDARKVTVPTLMIYGEADTATPIQSVGVPLHEAIQGSKLNIIHGADHFVHQHATDEVARMVQEFIAT